MSYISKANLSFDSAEPLLENVERVSMNSLKSTSPPWRCQPFALGAGNLRITYSVSVNDRKEPVCERIGSDSWDTKELFAIYSSRPIRIDLQETLAYSLNLFV